MTVEASVSSDQAEPQPQEIPSPALSSCLSTNKTSNDTKHPFYVDNKDVVFKHKQNDLSLMFFSDWNNVEVSMQTPTDERAIYFPPHLELQYDKEMEVQLEYDLRKWPFFNLFNQKLAQPGINMSHYGSFNSDLSYDRRILLHRYITWIFPMDEVSGGFPIYKLHATVGKTYLQNLKGITRNEPIEDIMQFKGKCPAELFQTALNIQRIFAEDLMPPKRKLLEGSDPQLMIGVKGPFINFLGAVCPY